MENTWALGILYIVVGLFIALKGLEFFPHVAAGVSGLMAWGLTFFLCVSANFAESTGGFWACLILTALVGAAVGYFIKKEIWLCIAALGAVGGFFGGIFLLALINEMFNWSEIWAWWCLGIGGALLGFYFSNKLGAPIVNLITSFVGSYFLGEALVMFCWPDHWPSASEMVNGDISGDLGW